MLLYSTTVETSTTMRHDCWQAQWSNLGGRWQQHNDFFGDAGVLCSVFLLLCYLYSYTVLWYQYYDVVNIIWWWSRENTRPRDRLLFSFNRILFFDVFCVASRINHVNVVVRMLLWARVRPADLVKYIYNILRVCILSIDWLFDWFAFDDNTGLNSIPIKPLRLWFFSNKTCVPRSRHPIHYQCRCRQHNTSRERLTVLSALTDEGSTTADDLRIEKEKKKYCFGLWKLIIAITAAFDYYYLKAFPFHNIIIKILPERLLL